MIAGIGTDIVEVERFEEFVRSNNERLLQRLFSLQELSYCRNAINMGHKLAARFAAKEAFLKALGTGFSQGVRWHDIEVISSASGAPSLLLNGIALTLANERHVRSIFLSMSHEKRHALAFVILES
jgi:holo-[acyl-carrier protein] synthase